MAAARPTLFSIPSGAPFLATLARSLLDGALVGPFDLARDPLALAAATVFLPTRRAARAFANELAGCFAGAPVLLPRIVPLGDLGEMESADAAASELDADAPPAIEPHERLITLARLVLDWSRRLGEAVVRPDPGDALLVASTPADALALAGDLAALLDTLAIEGRTFAELKRLAPERFDRYWDITLQFLTIAAEQWPNALAERGLIDIAAERDLAIRRRAALYRTGAMGPVIAAGSTGSMPATAELLDAIARLPRGAVVLPGLDGDLDDDSFALVGGDADRGIAPAPSHPQALLRALLGRMGVTRADVVALGDEPTPARARRRLLSQVMRPAETTEAWRDLRAEAGRADIATAFADVALVVAADEREEALAIAVALREAIETPGRTAALVTPDRALAERVAAALERWGIAVDDSAGRPLARMPAGVLARLIARCAAEDFSPLALVDLLAHPLASFGLRRGAVAAAAAVIETGVLRGALSPVRGLADLHARLEAARTAELAGERRPGARRFGAERWQTARDLVDLLVESFTGFDAAGLAGEHPVSRLAAAHRAVFEGVVGAASDQSDRLALDRLFEDLAGQAAGKLAISLADYATFFVRFSESVPVHPPRRAHARLKIWGLLEARLISADRLVLGGLVETVWPPVARTDAFLNRAMRNELGLPAPERRIGQSAHDFVAACGAGDVVLTRAEKVDGGPALESRFLRRLAACAGADNEAYAGALARGARFVELARLLDRPIAASSSVRSARPAPRPATALQPLRLSVTEAETLWRDPYAVHASRVLRLSPLDPLTPAIDARVLGSLIHTVLHKAAAGAAGAGADFANLFRAAARDELVRLAPSAGLAAFLEARLARLALSYAGFETDRRAGIAEVLTETRGQIEVALADGARFQLSARVDRIERRHDGASAILDFKTGEPPRRSDVLCGLALQLTLEAALLQRGAFGATLAAAPLVSLAHVKLDARGGEAKLDDLALKSGHQAALDLAETPTRHLADLLGFLDSLRRGERAFTSRRRPRLVYADAPTNHLARVAEWSLLANDQ